MALVNPNIAMSFRAPEMPQQNALADYAAIQQIQGGQQAQQLNALKMQEYERARTEEEGARNFLRGRDLASPDTRTGLTQFGKTGLALAKSLSEQDTAALTQRETLFKLEKGKRDFIAQAQRDTSQNPSDANITAFREDLLANPLFTEVEKKQMVANADRILAMPVGERRSFMASQGASASELKPVVTPQSLGGTARLLSTPAFGGAATQVVGSEGTVTATPAQIETNRLSQARLDFDRNKFNWEKANPGMELKEDENGNLFGINKRTLQVTPVTMGGGAPSAGGVGADVGKPFKGKDASKTAVSEQQAAYNVGRVLTAAKQINEIGRDDPSAVQPGGVEALAASVGMSGTANLARNANRQIIFGAQRDALDALLYLATGAAYNKEQLEGKVAAYIPSYTDKPENVIAKQERMTELIKSAKIRAGKSWTPEMDVAMKALTSSPAAAAAPRVAPPAGFTPD